MNMPKPGTPVRGSRSGRSVMALLDLLGRRMCLRILWELRDSCLRFRALQTAAETNPAVLNSRLGELKAAMLVELTAEGYQLTTQGNELIKLVLPMHDWAENWSRKIGDD
ncbi:MAG: helix-turn-helix transcriptional regulator [Rhodospirillaceae bacterium]|nr:helix-turn-helix transcriptional regulator [Rhodospirillaceae bacterium]MBT5526702.1 helix-turn-helix transcriptional regulator [Rhodospirillaceae bacterium]MBT5878460.1 helix-turn-helix transcriptional regulator [Rhodospirillaceae bacterium]MBT6589772.1 helix-turn-helix transcriptional regulator [Rhodospirillaceae bacterium]MBT7286189.1 helix-turn-helix transcriptional regulator [Rhodospirillaceae bacterium]